MAAPPPYWKRKTRPCPFYSQGRCLFADSCNFIHSAKFANEPIPQPFELASGIVVPEGAQHTQDYVEPSLEEGNHAYAVPSGSRPSSRSQGPKRSSSHSIERKRRSVRSPPRSPRLSGLLFALQSVIGPDVEEEEVSDEDNNAEGGEDNGEGGENTRPISGTPEPKRDLEPGPSSSTLPSYYSSSVVGEHSSDVLANPDPQEDEETYITEVDLPDVGVQEASVLLLDPSQDFIVPLGSPFDGSFNLTSEGPGFSMLSDFPEPPMSLPAPDTEPLTSTPKRSPSTRTKIPSPIVTQYSPMDETQVLEGNVIELRSTYEAPSTPSHGSLQSPLDLLSSPFSSPAKRILSLSPQFGAREPHSPIFGIFSGNATPIRKSKVYADDDVVSLESLNSPNGSPSSSSERRSEGGFSTDNAQTPKSNPHVSKYAETELDDIPPLPEMSIRSIEGLNGTLKDDEGEFTITAVSQMDASYDPSSSSMSFASESSWGNVNLPQESEEEYGEASYEEDDAASDGSRSPVSPTIRHGHALSVDDVEVVDSNGGDYSSDPSPVSADLHSSHTSETLVESPVSPEEKKKVGPRRLTFRSFSSPTKALRESSCPPSIEKTVRPEPSPLAEEYPPPRSASSMSSHSSQKTTWDEMSASSSQRVTFGFRHSRVMSDHHSPSISQASRHSHGKKRASPSRPNLSISTRLSNLSYINSLNFQPRTNNRSVSDPPSTGGPSWMRPLRLSIAVNTPSSSQHSHFSLSSSHCNRLSLVSAHSSISHVSRQSLVDNQLLSSSRTSLLSAYADADIPSDDDASPISEVNDEDAIPNIPTKDSALFYSQPDADEEPTITRHIPSQTRGALELDLLSPLSGSMRGFDFEEFAVSEDPHEDTCRTSRAPSSLASASLASANRASLLSVLSNVHAIATPKPTLLFAIASDDVAEVERVLSSGEVQPNEDVGPQSALEFALRSDQLVHKAEIVKTLLAFGADPSALPAELRESDPPGPSGEPAVNNDTNLETQPKVSKRDSMNPATRYFLNRANAPQSAQASSIRRSFFRPLTRIRYDLIGQDRALEHLYWVLNIHSQQAIVNPLVVLCCGPSGHGKSFLARKFGSLLGIPTHTVNMTVLQSSHDLWQCPSMSPYDPPSEKTLAEFLIENQGKRCVVVLDEIDKNEDERNLWSLLAPWESGRCSFDAGRRHIDVRNVIWLGTSNTGQNIIFEYHDARKDTDVPMSKQEYRELMALLRPGVSEKLGASLMSRITTVLPFVPFTSEEKLALAAEALLSVGGELARELSPDEFEQVAARSVAEYVPSEGARSLYRNVSTHLMEAA